jgi:hypothetical protein
MLGDDLGGEIDMRWPMLGIVVMDRPGAGPEPR